MQKLQAQLEEQLQRAREQNAERLASVEADAQQLEATARQEGEARCAIIQVHKTKAYSPHTQCADVVHWQHTTGPTCPCSSQEK